MPTLPSRPLRSPSDQVPRQLTARYRLDQVLGRGGMGVVYRSTDLLEQRGLAIKLLRAEADTDPEFVSRFIREVKHTARINHPNVIQILDVGRGDASELFFAMELLEGEPLSALLRRQIRIEPRQAAALVAQVCAALESAHAQGIVHRDIKPANVFLVRRAGEPERVKVLDFGVAKAIGQDTQITGTGLMVGTLEYMAPEQILGEEIDGRTDIYAVGAMLYKLLTGSGLFPDCAPAALVHHHLSVAPEAPRRRAPDAGIPATLEHIVQRCLAKKPAQRYPDARALGQALAAFLEGRLEEDPPTLDLRPSLDAALASGGLELEERSAPGTVAFLRCAACGSDNTRFAARCVQCDADLNTAEQRAYMRNLLAERGEEPTALPAPAAPAAATAASPAAELVAPAPALASSAPAPAETEGALHKLSAVLERVSPKTWMRVLIYSLLVAGVGHFFGLVSTHTAIALVLLAGAALVGLWTTGGRASD